MIIYFLLPLYNKIDNKHKILTPTFTIIIWVIFTIILSTFTNYNEIFILTNRIPIILLGIYISKYNILDKLSKKNYLLTTILLIILGLIILYKFNNINVIYIEDVFYLLGIPLTLGLILLINLIPTNKIINILGSITLEMYAIQMIFGYKIASVILKLLDNILLSNITTILIVIILSTITHYILKKS